MNNMLRVLTLLTFLFTTVSYAAKPTRDELHRFRLLRDRNILDRDLKKGLDGDKYTRFFDLDISASSGLKSLVADVSDISDSGTNATNTLELVALLTENVNAEWYADLGLIFGAPLPGIKVKKHRFLPSLFYDLNAALSISIDNKESTTNPNLRLFLKKDTKIGLFTKYKRNGNTRDQLSVALYQLSRSDLKVSQTGSDLATKTKIFDLDDLSKSQKSISTDIRYRRKFKHSSFMIELQELQLWRLKVESPSLYGSSPLLHLRTAKTFEGETFDIVPFFGFHRRKRYSVAKGLYLGTQLVNKSHIPLEGSVKFDNQFLTFTPQIKTSWVHFIYQFKTPYRNPQNNVWVPTIHSFNLSVPFP